MRKTAIETYKPIGYKFFILKPIRTAVVMLGIVISTALSANTQNNLDSLVASAKQQFYSNPIETQRLCNEAIHIAESIKDKQSIAVCKNILGATYFSTANYPKALTFFEDAYSLNTELGKKLETAKNLTNIGNIYIKTHQLEKALEKLFLAKKLYEELDYAEGILATNTNIGLIYKNVGNLAQAQKHYSKAKKIAEQTQNRHAYAKILYNLAVLQNELEQSQEGYKNALQALNFQIELKDFQGQIKSNTLIGLMLQQKNQSAKAIKHYENALHLADSTSNNEEKSNILNHLGYVYLQMKEYASAQQFLEQSLTESKRHNNTDLTRLNLEYLAEICELTSDYKMAYFYQQQLSGLKPAMPIFSVENRLAELEEKYELSKKENIRASKQLQKNKSLISYLICLLVIAILASIIIIMRIRLKAQKEITQLTQANLRSQMNPHFIFNVLNSIHYFILKNNIEASSNYLNKFARLLRLTLDHSQSQMVPINEELETLKLYLELESMRMNDNLEYNIEIDDDIDSYMFKMPTLLLQPFVENSIIHGFKKKEGKGRLNIALKLRKGAIHCSIEDNGVGRKKAENANTEQQEQHKSYGSSITETRIRLLNSFYGKSLGIEYSDLTDENKHPCGTRVEFDLPIMN